MSYGAQRIGDWIQVYSGAAFWPLDPRPHEIQPEDIAHALSLLCRFGGHCKRTWPMPFLVKDADRRILEDERRQNMNPSAVTWSTAGRPLEIEIECWTAERAEWEFLNRFAELTA